MVRVRLRNQVRRHGIGRLQACLLAVVTALTIATASHSTGRIPDLVVELHDNATATVLRVTGDTEITYSTRRLTAPDRFVVRVDGVIRSFTTPRPAGRLVKAVRVGQVRLDPEPVSEIVLDLGEPSKRSIGNTAAGLEVVFQPREASASVSTPGALFLTFELSELSVASGGGRVAVDWMPEARPRLTYLVGLSSSRLADAEWTVGRAMVAAKRGDRLNLRGGLHLGGGRRDGRGFDYRIAEVGAMVRIGERFYLDVENRYLDIDTTHGNLVQASLTYLPHRQLSSKLSFIRSTGGNTESEFVTGRLDYFVGRLHLLGGLAAGRTRPEVVEVLGGDAARLEQVFAGMAFPMSRNQLVVVLDYLKLDDVERGTLTLSLRLPVKRTVAPK